MPDEEPVGTTEETGSTGTIGSAARKATHWELNCRISALEVLSSAQAITVAALAQSGGDTDEAWQRLSEQLDELDGLRRQQVALERFARIKP